MAKQMIYIVQGVWVYDNCDEDCEEDCDGKKEERWNIKAFYDRSIAEQYIEANKNRNEFQDWDYIEIEALEIL